MVTQTSIGQESDFSNNEEAGLKKFIEPLSARARVVMSSKCDFRRLPYQVSWE